MREVAFAKQKTEGEKTNYAVILSAAKNPPDRGSCTQLRTRRLRKAIRLFFSIFFVKNIGKNPDPALQRRVPSPRKTTHCGFAEDVIVRVPGSDSAAAAWQIAAAVRRCIRSARNGGRARAGRTPGFTGGPFAIITSFGKAPFT